MAQMQEERKNKASASMEESKKVKLHGFRASPFAQMVVWALKLKGVEYEYIEEDLANKSAALLQYNPVHKKVPVLVHGGKPIAESAVILEYIDETWPDRAPFLPKDPYERAMARFWVDYGQQMSRTFHDFLTTSEEDKEKVAKEVLEALKILQDEALGDKKFFGGNTLGLVDLCFGWLPSFRQMERVVGVQILGPTTLPGLHRWVQDFVGEAVIKENLQDSEEQLLELESLRKRLLSSKN